MRRAAISVIFSLFSFIIPAGVLAGSGQSGAPGDSSCAACHGASETPRPSQSGGKGVFMMFSGGSTYTPGVTQSVAVTVVDTAFPNFGYQTSPRIHGEDATQGAGSLMPVDANAQFYPATGTDTREWIGANEGVDGPTTNTFHFEWTPPASGTVDFYVIGMGANGSGGPAANEHVYANVYTLNPAAATPKPTFPASGVVSAAASVPGLSPGAWISIYGQSLSSSSAGWAASDFINGVLPTSLAGVSVMIDGKPAAISFVKSTQINVQVPDDTNRGPVPIIVSSGGISSDPVMVNMSAVAPSFFTFDGTHLAATHADNTPITEAAPAKPGETVVLYGTGFGPTDPPTPSGMVVSTAHPLAASSSLTIAFDHAPAQILFAGVTAPGLYQFNVVLPSSLSDGDAMVVATIDSESTQANVIIPVHH